MSTFIKVTQLPEATGLTPDDFIMMVDEPGTIATSKKVKAEAIIDLITEIDGGEIVT